MQAITYMTRWTTYLLLIIPPGAGVAIGYFALKKSFANDPSEIAENDEKMRKTLKASVIAVTIAGFIEIVKRFY